MRSKEEGRRRETSHKAAAFFLINEFALQFRKAKERERERESEREWVDWERVSWNWKPILSDAFLFEISAKETLDRVTWFRAREIVQHNFPRVSIYFDIRLMD